MKKLLKKQGFTLVELIVVIAIMALLLAMLIPTLSNQQSLEQEVRENARAFYSNVQGLMVDEKLRETVLNSGSATENSKYTLIYAEVTLSDTATAQTDVSVVFGADITAIKSGTPAKINDEDHPIEKLQEFAGSLNKLLSASNNEGYYYAVVDDKYRVVYTYYSRKVDLDSLKAATFVSDYLVKANGEEYFLGAYPFFMNFSSEKWRWKDLLPNPTDIAYHLE